MNTNTPILAIAFLLHIVIALIVATVCFVRRRKDPIFKDYPMYWIEHFIFDGLLWPFLLIEK